MDRHADRDKFPPPPDPVDCAGSYGDWSECLSLCIERRRHTFSVTTLSATVAKSTPVRWGLKPSRATLQSHVLWTVSVQWATGAIASSLAAVVDSQLHRVHTEGGVRGRGQGTSE